MEAVIRAVDVGYGMTKFVVARDEVGGIVCHSFPSVVAPAAGDALGGGAFRRRATLEVAFGGRAYEVGRDVLAATGGHGSRNRDLQFVQSDTYQVLMRGAIKAMRLSAVDLLVLGVPVDRVDAAREHLRRTFTGTVAVDAETTVEVGRVAVLPQPLGALAWCTKTAGRAEETADRVTLIVDAGYFTLDWLVSLGLKLMPQRSGSAPFGVSAVIAEIAGELSRRLGIDVGSLAVWERVDRALHAGKPLMLEGRPIDLAEYSGTIGFILDQGVQALAASVGSMADIDQVVLVGGGAPLYARALRRVLREHPVLQVERPCFANVQGFQLVGEDVVASGRL